MVFSQRIPNFNFTSFFMKRTISKVLLTAVTAAVMLTACSKQPEQTKHIPKAAGLVIGLNAKQLSQKLVTNGITMDKLFSTLQSADTSSQAMKAWKDAENSGIDLTSNFFAAFVFNNKGAMEAATTAKSYASVTGSLKDEAKFEAYLKQNVPNFTLKTQNDFKYIWEAKEGAIIGWSKGTVIYLRPFDANNISRSNPLGTPDTDSDYEHSEDNVAVDSAIASPASAVAVADDATEKIWAAELDHLFHLKKEESANAIDAFAEVMKQGADMTVYANPDAIYTNQLGTMVPANVRKLMEGCYYTGTLNFENGKVVMNGLSYIGKQMADIYQKYGKVELDMDMLTKYPSENVTGFLAYGFDFRMIGDIVKATGMDGLANMAMAKSGLTLDDVLNAFKGQLVYVASDFAINKVPSEYIPGDSTTKPTSKWVFSLKVGDKAAFEKVMTSPMLKEMFVKEGNEYKMAQQLPDMPALSINDKFVTAASDTELLTKYLAGTGKIKVEGGLEGKMKGNALGAYVNFEKLAANIPENEVPEDGKPLMLKAKNLLKDMVVIGHTFNGKTQASEVVFNFKNQTENSLAQIINLGTEAAKYFKDKEAKENGAYDTDSTAASTVDAADAVPAHK
jgi:hypothetical protein